jgi:hypothetical protein
VQTDSAPRESESVQKEAIVFSLLKRHTGNCKQLLESLVEIDSETSLPAELATHAACCQDCKKAIDELLASRALLRTLPRQQETPKPWFATRVMAVIAEQEAQLERSLETWVVLPKLASRLAWVSALALLLTTTFLIQRPKAVPVAQVSTDLSGEPVVENHPLPVDNDEVLATLTEQAE